MQLHDLMVNYVEMLDQSCVEFPHSHPDYEFYYCLDGSMTLRASDEKLQLSRGHFVLLTPGIMHGTIYEPNVQKKYLVMIFGFRETSSPKNISQCEKLFFDSFKMFQEKSHYAAKAKDDTRKITEKMEQEIKSKHYGWEIMLRTYCLEYIISLMRNLIPEKENEEAGFTNPNLAIEITKYMHSNYNKNITLHDVAENMHVTPRHISRLFEEYFGKSFQSTLSIYRLNYAKNYLLDSDYSIEKISELVGFSTPQTLFKLFRNHEGMTVSQYRSLYKDVKRQEKAKTNHNSPDGPSEK